MTSELASDGLTFLEPVATHGPRARLDTGEPVPCAGTTEPYVPGPVYRMWRRSHADCEMTRKAHVGTRALKQRGLDSLLSGARARRYKTCGVYLKGAAECPPVFTVCELGYSVGVSRNAASQWLLRAVDAGQVERVSTGRYVLAAGAAA